MSWKKLLPVTLLFLPLFTGCLMTSVQVENVETYSGTIPNRRSMAKAANTGANGLAEAISSGNSSAQAFNAGSGGVAIADSDGYSRNNPEDPGDPDDRLGLLPCDNGGSTVKNIQYSSSNKPDSTSVFGDFNPKNRALIWHEGGVSSVKDR